VEKLIPGCYVTILSVVVQTIHHFVLFPSTNTERKAKGKKEEEEEEEQKKMGSTSTTSSLVLEEATIEDFPAIRDIWFAAFTQPVIGELFPDSPGMRQWVLNDWHLNDFKTRPFQKYLRVVDTASRDEQGRPRVVAFGKWDLSMPQERGRRFPQWHPSSPYERCEELINSLDKERMRVMGDEKHYCKDGPVI
jgi:hypothetical protein